MKNVRRKQTVPSQGNDLRCYLYALVVSGVALIVYVRTLTFGFVFDDIENILNNPAVINFQPSNVVQLFLQPWRAVTQISYGITYHFFGFNPAVFHLGNVVIHMINSVLVYGIARLLASRWLAKDKVVLFSVAAGLIFAVHPLHSEAVAYVWGRSSSLCALFYFGALLMELVGFTKTGWKRFLWFGLAVLAGFLAWKTKEEAITLPFLAAGLAALIGWRRTAVGVALLPFIIVASRWGALLQIRSSVAENKELVSAGLSPALEPLSYFLTSVKGIVCYYLKLYILPVGQCADAYLEPVSRFWDISLLFSAAVLAGLIVLGVVMRADRLFVSGLLALLISPLASYAILPLADVVAEHRIYIAGLGFAMLAAWILVRLPGHRYAVVAGIATILGLTTLLRIQVWTDSLKLWKDVERKSPMLVRPHLNLGMAYQTDGMDDLAIAEYEHALKINPRLAPAYVNMAGIFFKRNDLENSEYALKKAMEMAPDLPAPYLNLAQIAMMRNRPQEALEILDKVQEDKISYFLHLTKGDAYAQLGRYEDAVREYETAAKLRPDLPEVAEFVKERLNRLKQLGAIR